MYIVEVHPEFADEVLAEVRSRGGPPAEARWREALDRLHRESDFNHEMNSLATWEPTSQTSDVRSLGQEVELIIARKYERDIDLLLAEEFAVSPSFATWFLAQTRTFKGKQARVIKVEVSRSDTTGESDLVVVLRRPRWLRSVCVAH